MTPTIKKIIDLLVQHKSYLPIFYVIITVYILSMHMHWQGDAIAFSYFMPRHNEDFSSIPFHSVTEIWQSMCNHYMHSTGRFFSHGIAQFFCAFAGKTWFSIFNALAWGCMIIVLIRLSKANVHSLYTTLFASALMFILYFSYGGSEHSFPFEPPHQIDYVWMNVINGLWIILFFSRKTFSKFQIMLSVPYSFICGQSNESFSIPIAGALVIFAVAKKLKLSHRQWIMAIFYAIGALIVILAPGNFSRLNTTSGAWSPIHILELLMPAMIIPLILVCICIAKRHNSKFICDHFCIFAFSAILINYALGVFVGMGSGTRIVTCANSLIIVYILKLTKNNKLNVINAFVLCSVLITIPIYRYNSITKLNIKNILIEHLYHISNNGVIEIPDKMFLYKSRDFIVRPHSYMMKERENNPTKPNIIIRPHSMKNIDLSKDTNALLKIDNQAWILIQSKSKPANFIVDKTLLPNLLNKKLQSRTINWESKMSDIVFDSCNLWKAALYINERPYIISNVKIEEP